MVFPQKSPGSISCESTIVSSFTSKCGNFLITSHLGGWYYYTIINFIFDWYRNRMILKIKIQ